MLNTINVNGIKHFIVNDTMLLVYAAWKNSYFILLNQKNPIPINHFEKNFSFAEKGPRLIDSNNQEYFSYIVANYPFNLTGPNPKGIFVSSNFESTIYRFLLWCFKYNGLDVTDKVIKALANRATLDSSTTSKLPDVMKILRYDWNGTKQLNYYEGRGALYEILPPTGFIEKDKTLFNDFKAIYVSSPPISADLITNLILKPTLKALENDL